MSSSNPQLAGKVESRRRRLVQRCAGLCVVAAATGAACGGGATDETPLLYLGEALIAPAPTTPGEPTIGGLSSLFHVGGGLYYAVSDDRGEHGPPRYYTISIDLRDGSLDEGDATINAWHVLRDQDGGPFPPDSYDLEGFVARGQNFFVSSEGDAAMGIAPFVGVFDRDDVLIERLGLPPGFAPSADGTSGVRNNMAFEALSITDDGRYLFTATENALVQDGPVATPAAGSRARILRFDRDHGVFANQYAYDLEPVHAVAPGGGLAVTGIVEVIALAADHLLVLERSFAAGADHEHSIKLFEACLAAATDVSALASLAGDDAVVPASKRLIADLAALAPRIDNIEGMTFGPDLPSGDPTLLVISDDNFSPDRQVTQILAFAIAPDAIRGCAAADERAAAREW